MQLPLVNSEDQSFQLLQTKWKSILDPLLSKRILQGNLIGGIALTNADTPINHLLGRMPLGWFLADIDNNATVWRSGNYTVQTITLRSSSNVNVNIWVF